MERTTSSNLRGPDSGRDNCSARLLFERYETDTRFFDEIFESAEQPRAHYRMLINEMCGMPQGEVERLQDRVARSFLHEGITFTVYGDEASIERAFPIDCVPRLLLAREWAHVERGLIQCVQALNLFLSDVYDKGHLLRDGSVPRDLVYGCPNYRPEMEGVADDKAVYAYVPRMIRYYLDQDPILDNVETHLCREPEGLAYTLENLEHLVVKAVGEAGGYGMLVGPHASREEREAFADKLRAKPENYISQPTLALSRAPCLVEGRLEARHVDPRPFVLHGEDTRVVPGGLCRVALRKGGLVVNSSQGGGAKDAWILEGDKP